MVALPEMLLFAVALSITFFISLMPDVTALKETRSQFVALEMRKARVVLPEPGGPQKIIDGTICLAERILRSGLSSPIISPCPTNSSNVMGRMRSAKGAGCCGCDLFC